MAEACTQGVDTGFVALGYAKVAFLGVVQGLTELMMDATDPAASDPLSEAVRKRYLSMRKTMAQTVC